MVLVRSLRADWSVPQCRGATQDGRSIQLVLRFASPAPSPALSDEHVCEIKDPSFLGPAVVCLLEGNNPLVTPPHTAHLLDLLRNLSTPV